MIKKEENAIGFLCRAAKSGFDLSVHAGDIPTKKAPSQEWKDKLESLVIRCQRDYEQVVGIMKAILGRAPEILVGDHVIKTTACEWRWNELGCYETSCGKSFEVNHGTPHDNGMLFCPMCGKILQEEEASDERD